MLKDDNAKLNTQAAAVARINGDLVKALNRIDATPTRNGQRVRLRDRGELYNFDPQYSAEDAARHRLNGSI